LTGATDKSSWDGARLKLTTSSASGGSAALLAAQVNLLLIQKVVVAAVAVDKIESFHLR
jgi:hypothetical protein